MNTWMPKYAARLNSFAARPELYWGEATARPTTIDLLERLGTAPVLTAVDLNYPDHLTGVSHDDIKTALDVNGLELNGFQVRYYGNPAFSLGAFAHPNPSVREEAIVLTLEGIDRMTELGANLMTLWLGQDGFDYSFQVDYGRCWDQIVEGIQRVATHNPDVQISIEYKPNEPRAFSFLGDIGTTLLAIKEVGLPNLGVTLDFCHVLYAQEQPAYAARLAHRYSKLLGLHLNDGYGKRDDGLMVGSVNLISTLEVLYTARELAYEGVIYFDTFPHSEDPVQEYATNVSTVQALIELTSRIDRGRLHNILAAHDAVGSQRLLQDILLTRDPLQPSTREEGGTPGVKKHIKIA